MWVRKLGFKWTPEITLSSCYFTMFHTVLLRFMSRLCHFSSILHVLPPFFFGGPIMHALATFSGVSGIRSGIGRAGRPPGFLTVVRFGGALSLCPMSCVLLVWCRKHIPQWLKNE